MKWKVNFLLLATLALAAISIFDFPDLKLKSVFSAKILEISSPSSSDSMLIGPSWTITEKIAEGRNLLSGSFPLRFTENGRSLVKKETALAVMDTVTGEIFEARYWLDEKEVKKANSLRQTYAENEENLPVFAPSDDRKQFRVITRWWNNFNSDLLVVNDNDDFPEKQDHYAVLGIKFLMNNDNLAYPEDQTGSRYSDMVYIPYSDFLHQAKLVKEGKDFLNQQVAEAFAALKKLEIESQAFSGRLVTETLEQIFIKNIFLTEQTDPLMMLLADDGGKKLAERVLVRLGANKEKAFRYTFSKTGALGLGQIMPGTYRNVIGQYMEANLIKDVDVGRVDITNSIMASVLVFDDHLAYVLDGLSVAQRKLFDKKQKENPDFINEIRAAIYNGGPGKYQAATATISTKVSETVNFVRKYKTIRQLNIFKEE